jgi:hypothetical protein
VGLWLQKKKGHTETVRRGAAIRFCPSQNENSLFYESGLNKGIVRRVSHTKHKEQWPA